MTHTYIDIANASQARYLYQILTSNRDKRFWLSKHNMQDINGNTYQLSHNLVIVQDPDTEEFIYKALSNSVFAKTEKSYIYKIDYAFKFNPNMSLQFIDCSRQVVKRSFQIKEQDDSNFFQSVESEYAQSSRLQHLGMYPPVYLQGQALLVMNKMPGVELFEFLKVIYDKSIRLPVKFLLLLTDAILQAFKEQVVAYEITHHDVKPENMLIGTEFGENLLSVPKEELENFVPSNLEINFIDYSYAKPYGYSCKHNGGSFGYCAPEFSKSIFNNEKYDLYAIGIILQIIWGLFYFSNDAKELFNREKQVTVKVVDEAYARYFANAKEQLPYATYLRLCIMIVNMVKTYHEDRWSLQQVENAFERIVLASPLNPYEIFSMKRNNWQAPEIPNYLQRNTSEDISVSSVDIEESKAEVAVTSGITLGSLFFGSAIFINAFLSGLSGVFSLLFFRSLDTRNDVERYTRESSRYLYRVHSKSMVAFTCFDPDFNRSRSEDIQQVSRAANGLAFFTDSKQRNLPAESLYSAEVISRQPT